MRSTNHPRNWPLRGKRDTVSLVERAYLDGSLPLGRELSIRQLSDLIGRRKLAFGGGCDNLLLALAERRSPLKLVKIGRGRLRVDAR